MIIVSASNDFYNGEKMTVFAIYSKRVRVFLFSFDKFKVYSERLSIIFFSVALN